jgi:hypothetical protein
MKARDVIGTLTGFDELAIERVTGKSFEEISATGRDILLARSLAAVLFTREDDKLTMPAAWQKALGMSQRDLGAVFTDEDGDGLDDLDDLEDEPVTEAGKDESGTSSEHASSLGSSS